MHTSNEPTSLPLPLSSATATCLSAGVPNGYFTLRAGAACTAMQQCINVPATCTPALQATKITLPATNFTGPLDTCAAEGIMGGTQLNRVLLPGVCLSFAAAAASAACCCLTGCSLNMLGEFTQHAAISFQHASSLLLLLLLPSLQALCRHLAAAATPTAPPASSATPRM